MQWQSGLESDILHKKLQVVTVVDRLRQVLLVDLRQYASRVSVRVEGG